MAVDHHTLAQERLDESLRGMSPAKKLALVDAMWRSARELTRAGIRQRHPELTDEQLDAAVARSLAGGSD